MQQPVHAAAHSVADRKEGHYLFGQFALRFCFLSDGVADGIARLLNANTEGP
jgi:hypothetical protein